MNGIGMHSPEGDRSEESSENELHTSSLPESREDTVKEISEDLRSRLGEHSYVTKEAETSILRPTWPITHIHTPKQLVAIAEKLERVARFSVDTETWGPKVLSDQLCLIQISIPPEELHGRTRAMTKGMGQTFLIDVVALDAHAVADGKEKNSLRPLRGVLESEKIEKIVHHAQFEKGQFEKYGIELSGIVDTERLTKYIRPDLKSYSLQACVLEVMGREMSKEEQTSRWVQRPLTQEQIEYAALDAEVVIHLHNKLTEIDKRATPRHSMKLETLMKGVWEAQQERDALLGEPEVHGALDLLRRQVELCREQLRAILLSEADEGLSDNYRGPYGVASQRRLPIEQPNLERLRELLPDIAEQVIQGKTTKNQLKGALEELGRASETNTIWAEINADTGTYTQPRLSLEFSAISSTERETTESGSTDSEALDAATLGVLTKSDLMERLLEAELGQLQVIRSFGLGDQLAALDTKIQKYSERIYDRLIELADGAPQVTYKCSHGVARLTSRPKRAVDIEHLKEHYPEVAARCVTEQLSKTELTKALRAMGAEPKTAESMMREIFIPTGEFSSPRISIRPNYGLFYKGIELPPEGSESVYGDDIGEDFE